jgi:hypothetical protein
MAGDPYRSPPSAPQFVCVVCYRSLSVHPGECPRCGVERLPLSDPAVRAEVRDEAERRLDGRLYGEWFWCYLGAFIAAIPVRFVIVELMKAIVVWVAAGMALGALNVRLYERLNPRSVLRLYADRRRRLALAGADAQHLLPARADDPEDAELPRVLALLGAKLDDER